MTGDVDRLLDEARDAPADTWDFGWLDGRATEARPTWRYFDRAGGRVQDARRLLDIDTGTQPDRQALPFIDASFDLIISRHPVETWWNEVARVPEPGATTSEAPMSDASRTVRDAIG